MDELERRSQEIAQRLRDDEIAIGGLRDFVRGESTEADMEHIRRAGQRNLFQRVQHESGQFGQEEAARLGQLVDQWNVIPPEEGGPARPEDEPPADPTPQT